MSFIITDKCVGCSACEIVCPVDAISGVKKEYYFIDPKVCIDCGACGRACPCVSCYLCESACDKGAIVLMPPEDIAPAAAARFQK